MNRYSYLIILLLANASIQAQEYKETVRNFKEVTVLGRRPMKDIGTQQTKFDSLALKENIALSMADVLTFNSSIFVKNYGRATLSTVAFRGTSPSHTQVTWNGMRISNPMLGMTDFSTIPSYFIDNATLLHGTSSVNESGGGLGGAVKMSTSPTTGKGFGMQYIQGMGSFKTFDEFLRLTYGAEHWQFSTRAVLSTSPNDYKYRNHDKKENVYDEDMNIIGQYYPIERNKSGSFRDFHILQEAYYRSDNGNSLGLNAWYMNSNRELAMLTTDYGDEMDFDNRQREETFRGILSWKHTGSNWTLTSKAGYVHTWMAYDYKRDVGNGNMAHMTRSRSEINTLYAQMDGEYYIGNKWLFTANMSAHQHFVQSKDKNIILQEGNKGIVGYQQGRIELSGSTSAKWQPNERVGLSLVLREEMFGTEWAPVIPALFVDGVISRRGNIMAKASVSRNFRFPSLNDLYFLPGGNPELRKEVGWTYDAGISFTTGKTGKHSVFGSVNWFDARITDWIIWLPTPKGFFSPKNIKDVHAYGVEIQGKMDASLNEQWRLGMNGTYSWTPSTNEGEPISMADKSVGKQLPYVPKHSASLMARLSWQKWSLLYKWCYYSKRFTMSSNDVTLTGKLPAYFMSNVTIEKGISRKWADLNIKGAINNLFNEEYLSVLSRPMPGINFEIFVGITPKW